MDISHCATRKLVDSSLEASNLPTIIHEETCKELPIELVDSSLEVSNLPTVNHKETLKELPNALLPLNNGPHSASLHPAYYY